MAAIIPYLGYIAMGVAVAGQVQQGQAKKKADYTNAKIREQQAATVRQQTVSREELHRSNVRGLIGEQLAAGAESGLELSGSRADILRETLYNAELDALNIRYEGELSASGLETQAGFDRFSGRQAANSGYLNAASSLMSGASGYMSKGGSIPYNYNGDASGEMYSRTGEQVRGRR